MSDNTGATGPTAWGLPPVPSSEGYYILEITDNGPRWVLDKESNHGV